MEDLNMVLRVIVQSENVGDGTLNNMISFFLKEVENKSWEDYKVCPIDILREHAKYFREGPCLIALLNAIEQRMLSLEEDNMSPN